MTTTVPKPEFKVLGKRVPKAAGVEMVTGNAVYAADVRVPGMLVGKVLRSPYAHAAIKHIDVSKAEGLPGVKAVITAKDIPESKVRAQVIGETPIDLSGIIKLVIAREKALYHNHAVAAVAAVDEFTATEALKLLEVEYEPLPPVLDLREAMKPDSPIVDPNLKTRDPFGGTENPGPTNVASHSAMVKGDVANGFEEADIVVEQDYEIGRAHMGYIEPMACIAHWEPDDHLTVWTSTQGSFGVQSQLAAIFTLPGSKVKVVPTEIGGGFGGKIYVNLEPLAAALSKKSGRPVQLVMSREEVLRSAGPGTSGIVRLKMGCRKDGTLTAIEAWSAADSGCHPGGGGINIGPQAFNKYRIPNIKVDSYDVITNKVRNTSYRAPGSIQGSFCVEQHIDMMAQAIGMDPVDFHIKNSVQEGDLLPTGQRQESTGVLEIYERIKDHPHYTSRLEGPNRGRGVAVGFWGGVVFTSSAHVMLNRDGTVSVLTGIVDLTGTRTTFQQMVAEELQLDPAEVSVTQASTDVAPFADLSGGSRITYTMSAVLHKACQELLSKLKARVAERLNVSPDQIDYKEKVFFVRGEPEKRLTLAQAATTGEGVVTATASVSKMRQAPMYAASVVDVEVDPESGKVQVLRVTAFQDVGKAVNPSRVEAQMQGGASQSIGWGLWEEYLFDDKGFLRNASLLDYRKPTSLDLPMIDCEIIEHPAPDSPYGVRGVGEVPQVPHAAAIANAIARAVGIRCDHMPMTPERVYFACKNKKLRTNAITIRE